MGGLPAEAFGRWVHAREEDADGVEVYRPRGYRLPPARGRPGIEIRADGTFVDWRIGPGDAGEPVEARWEAAPAPSAETSGTVVRILRSLRTGRAEEELEVVEAGPDLLRVRRRPGPPPP